RPVQPEPPESRPEPQCGFAPAVLEQPGKRGAKVRQLQLEAVERLRAQVTHPRQPLTRVELLGDAEEGVVVATSQGRRIRKIAKVLECELSDGHESEKAPVLAVSQQALVNQRLQGVELCGANGFRRLELEAPGEHGQPCKQSLLVGSKESIAPLDGPAQGALPLRC